MKLFRINIIAVLSAFLALFACSDEVVYQPGAGEDENTEGVYFPLQLGYSNEFNGLELDPEDDTFVEVVIKRTKIETSVESVPFELKTSHEGIFTLSEISFAEGQTETTAILDFSDAEIGVDYYCNIIISDPSYVSIYGNKRSTLGVSLVRASWKQVLGPNGETLGKWREDMFNLYGVNGFAEREVEVFEREDKPGVYRLYNVYDADFLGQCINKNPADLQNNWREASIVIDASDPNKVWIAQQDMGIILNNTEGWMSMSSYTPEGHSSFADADSYGTLQDGIITFPKGGIICYLENKIGAAFVENQFEQFRLILPGVKQLDLSCELSVSEPESGNVKIDIQMGADVARVGYAYFEGRLSAEEVNLKSIDMQAGLIEAETITESAIFDKSFEKTGLYTLVANVYDAEGSLVEYTFSNFGYILNGDSKDVVLSLGVDMTDKFAPDSLTKENSAHPWIYGEDIEYATFAFVKTKTLRGLTEEQIIEDVKKKGNEFDEDQLKLINGDGISFLVRGLHAATDYTLLVYAYNGFVSQIFEAEATTEGVYNILNDYFTFNDIARMSSKQEVIKSWNVWAVNHNDKKNKNRQNLGTWTFSDDAQDENSRDYISLDGIALHDKVKPITKWEYYNGYVFSLGSQELGMFTTPNADIYLKYYPLAADDNVLFEQEEFTMLGGLADEGYMAFVSNPEVSTKFECNGVLIGVFYEDNYQNPTSNFAWYSNILLQDPAVAEPMPQVVSQYKQELYEMSKKMRNADNFVELRGLERIKSIIDEANSSKIKNLVSGQLELTAMPEAKQVK